MTAEMKDLFTVTLKADSTENRLAIVKHCMECSGFSYFSSYGLFIDIKDTFYADAKRALLSSGKYSTDSLCYEDVLAEIIAMGNHIDILDTEADEEPTPALIGVLSMATIEKNWDALRQSDLLALYEEADDANTADCILQTLCFGEIIYG